MPYIEVGLFAFAFLRLSFLCPNTKVNHISGCTEIKITSFTDYVSGWESTNRCAHLRFLLPWCAQISDHDERIIAIGQCIDLVTAQKSNSVAFGHRFNAW